MNEIQIDILKDLHQKLNDNLIETQANNEALSICSKKLKELKEKSSLLSKENKSIMMSFMPNFIRDIYLTLLNEANLPKELIENKKSRINEYVEIRIIISHLLVKTGFKYFLIGKAIGWNHATIYYHDTQFKVYYKVDKRFRAIADSITSKYLTLNIDNYLLNCGENYLTRYKELKDEFEKTRTKE